MIGILWLLTAEGMVEAQCSTYPCNITANTPASTSVLSITNSGQGGAATFNNSQNSSAQTVTIDSFGPGAALITRNQGGGGAAFGALSDGKLSFASINIGKGASAVIANENSNNTDAAIIGLSTGLGTVGGFLSLNQFSKEPTVLVGNANQSSAARFFTLNISNMQPSVEAISYGQGSAMRVSSHGGVDAFGLEAWNDSAGGAIWAHTDSQSSSYTLIATTNDSQSWGVPLHAASFGLGPAARFRIHNSNNSSEAILALTKGAGQGVRAASLGGGDSIQGIIPLEATPISSPTTIDGGRAAVRGLTAAETGNAGAFHVANSKNANPALWASHDSGLAVFADCGSNNAEAIRTRGGIKAYGPVNIWHSPQEGHALRVFGYWDDGIIAYFYGDVAVNGTLYAAGKMFRIDHPLDPEQMYLNHASVESPEMTTVYNGMVSLDSMGEARVDLPRYFEALNRDIHYQLTAVGGPAPNLHIKKKVIKNTFIIGGGTAGLEVSWQVTGVRKDPYAEHHRSLAEVRKEAKDRGKYLHPREWGKPLSKGIAWEENAQKPKDTQRQDPDKSVGAARANWQGLAKQLAEDEKRVQAMVQAAKKQPSVPKKDLEAAIGTGNRLLSDTVKGMQTK